jgi:tetratricopeptide (TPR) repeat protein
MSKLDCLTLVEQAQSELFGPKRAAWLERLEQEYDPLRATLGQLLDSGEAEQGLRLAAGLREFWLSTGRIDEGRDWLRAFLALPEAKAQTAIRARALDVAGALAFWQSDRDMAGALMQEALAIRRELDDKQGIALSLIHVGQYKWMFESNYTAAQVFFEESLAIYEGLGSETDIAAYPPLQNLGHLAVEQGDFRRAQSLLRRSLLTLRDKEDIWAINFALDGLAGLAAGQGQPEKALRLAGASETLRESAGIRLPPVWQARMERLLEPAREMLDEAGCSATWAEGQAMNLERAVAFALDERLGT